MVDLVSGSRPAAGFHIRLGSLSVFRKPQLFYTDVVVRQGRGFQKRANTGQGLEKMPSMDGHSE